MMRPPATVVIPVWNAWEHTRRCLDSLRPTLGLRDRVVVVDNGSSDATEVERLVGFCLAVKASAFAEVGGFDERFEVGGYEDDDLCQRLRDAGGRLVIAHSSFVHHVGHQTFDANDVDWFELQERNRTVLAAKHSEE